MSQYTNSDLGAVYIGVLISAILYGVTTVQTYFYFHNCQRDRQALICMVACVWILDTLQVLCAAHGGYIYLVSSFGDNEAILSPTWSIIGNLYITTFTDSGIRMYFGWRVLKLCGPRRTLGKTLFCAIMSLSLLAFSSITVYISHIFVCKTFDKLANDVSNLVFIGIGAAVAGDILVAASLCSIVTRMRSGSEECNSVVNFLLTFFINTGLLTCLTTIACLLTFIAMRQICITVAIFFTLGKLYTNTLLASLNARKFIRHDKFGLSPTKNNFDEHVVSLPIHFKTVAETLEE